MKGILIDATNKTVTDVVYDSTKVLKEWYRLINCNTVEGGHIVRDNYPKLDQVMVDEEGLLSLTDETPFFNIEGSYQPYVGNGLIVGLDRNTGKTIDVGITSDEIRDKVTFLSLSEVRNMTQYIV